MEVLTSFDNRFLLLEFLSTGASASASKDRHLTLIKQLFNMRNITGFFVSCNIILIIWNISSVKYDSGAHSLVASDSRSEAEGSLLPMCRCELSARITWLMSR